MLGDWMGRYGNRVVFFLRMCRRWFHSQRKVLWGRAVLEGKVDGQGMRVLLIHVFFEGRHKLHEKIEYSTLNLIKQVSNVCN